MPDIVLWVENERNNHKTQTLLLRSAKLNYEDTLNGIYSKWKISLLVYVWAKFILGLVFDIYKIIVCSRRGGWPKKSFETNNF